MGLALTGAQGAPLAVRACIETLGPPRVELVDPARLVATSALREAGVEIDFAGGSCQAPATSFDIQIWLSPADPAQPGRCGRAVRNRHGVGGTVVLSMSCVDEVRLRASRSNDPRAARLHSGDIAGAALAHELGHLLGLRHASTGLMRARLDLADLVALAEGRLAFGKAEAAAMRAALKHQAADTYVLRER
jgi:hypothetical protein